MDRIFYALILFVFAIIHLYMIYVQNRRNGSSGVYSAMLFTMLVFFEILPMIFFLSNKNDLVLKELQIYECSFQQFIYAELGVLIFTVFFHIAYRQINNREKNKAYYFERVIYLKFTKKVFWITFVIGFITLSIYIHEMGGVDNLFRYANYLRSFATSGQSLVSYFASLMVIPARLILVAPILLPAIITATRNVYLRIFFKCVFVVSFVMSVIFLFSNAGKTDVIVFVMCFAVPFLMKRVKRPWFYTVVISILALPFVDFLDQFFMYLQEGKWEQSGNSIFETLNQFAYPYLNILYLSEITGLYGFRWGSDFITAILNNIPGMNFSPTYEVTSEFFNGPEWKKLGGRPVDIISLGNIELGLVGIGLVAIVAGIVFGKIDRMLKEMPNNSTYNILKASIIINTLVFAINADPFTLLRTQFQFIFAIWIVLVACRRQRKNNLMEGI